MNYIFLHGWSFSKDIWREFFYLKDSLFLDLPFHNDNKYYKADNILDKFSTDLYNLINSLNYETTIIGWSLGASVGVLTALKKPKNLKKLILIGFTPKFNDEKLGHSPKYIKAFLLQLRKDFEKTIYNFRLNAVDNTFKDIPLPIKNGSIKLLKEFIKLDLTDRLKDIDTETLLIAGKNDRIVNYNGSIYASKFIKNNHLILTEGHHGLFLDKPNLILNQL